MPIYNKLVRDFIPQIIESKGKRCSCEVLDDERYAKELRRKLHEEIQELIEAGNRQETTEELADVLEVLHAYASLRGITVEQAEQARERKAAERGRFADRLFLIEVAE